MTRENMLFEAFRNAMMRNVKGSRAEAFGYFLDTVRRDPKYLSLLSEEYFYRNAANWEPKSVAGGAVFAATKNAENRLSRASVVRNSAKRVERELERFRSIILLDLVLPCGKKLRDARGSDLDKARGWLAEVRRHVGPTEVVDKKLTEDALRAIRARYYDNVKAA